MLIRNLCALIVGMSLSGWAHASVAVGGIIGDMPVLIYDESFNYRVANRQGLLPKYDRKVSVKIKIPLALALGDGEVDWTQSAEQAPIVLYSHGSPLGSITGHIDASNQNWTDELVQRGYITINIAHAPPTNTKDQIASCSKVGISNSPRFGLTYTNAGSAHNMALPLAIGFPLDPAGDCANFKASIYLKYRDVKAVLHRLDTYLASQAPEMADLWDGKLAYMGHSSGAGTVLSMAGAHRSLLSSLNTYVTNDQTRFDAYIALSPQSYSTEPHYDGFAADAWSDIKQPVLMMTGELDSTAGQPALSRKEPYENMPDDPNTDDKYLIWFKGLTSGHSQMQLNGISVVGQNQAAIRTVERFLAIYARGDSSLVLDEDFVTDNQSYNMVDFESK